MAEALVQRHKRIPVDVQVEVSTVLTNRVARITDLTEGGAKITGDPFAVGETVKITTENDAIVWATVRWAEHDRMGVQFETLIPRQLLKRANWESGLSAAVAS